MMRRFVIAFAAALSLCLYAGGAASAPAAPVTLRVGVENLDYYPFYASDGQHFWGFARELLDAFAQRSGYRLVYEPLPPARLFQLFLGSQRLDLKFPDNPAWSREAKQYRQVSYSRPVATLREGLTVRRAQSGQPLARFHTLGILRGFSMPAYQPYIARGQIRVHEGDSLDGLLQELARGNIDGVYADFQVAQERIKLLQLDGALVPDSHLPVDHSDLALSSLQHPEVIAAFNRFLRTNPSLVQALERRYGLVRPER